MSASNRSSPPPMGRITFRAHVRCRMIDELPVTHTGDGRGATRTVGAPPPIDGAIAGGRFPARRFLLKASKA